MVKLYFKPAEKAFYFKHIISTVPGEKVTHEKYDIIYRKNYPCDIMDGNGDTEFYRDGGDGKLYAEAGNYQREAHNRIQQVP